MMVRFPQLAHPASWAAAAVGYVAADIFAGDPLWRTLVFSIGNMLGVIVGYLLFRRLPRNDQRLRRPLSVMRMILVCCAASAAGGVVGAIAIQTFFNGGVASGWLFWFIAEITSFVSILPVLLSAPSAFPRALIAAGRRAASSFAPVAAVVASCAASLIGGPGALAFPAAALLWCALSYSLFATSIITLLASSWTRVALSIGYVPIDLDMQSSWPLLSVRLGVALVALGPIVVACVMAARDDALKRLERAASHDGMTGLLNRQAFMRRAGDVTRELAATSRPVVALMLDIDEFKKINDAHGHAVGDRTIAAFSAILRARLRSGDLAGRLGGEEFAAILPDCGVEEAAAIAERIRCDFAATAIDIEGGARSLATISIGVAFAHPAPDDLDHLLSVADRALYDAKRGGRNRVAGAGPSGALPSLLETMRGDRSDEIRQTA